MANGDMSREQASIWLKSLTIHAPCPTFNSLQKVHLEDSRSDVLQRQCHVLLEHPRSPSLEVPPTIFAGIGGSKPAPERGITEPGIFRGLCMFSFTPGLITTGQGCGFWYQKGFVSDDNAINTKHHPLGWHKQPMKSKTYNLVDLKNLVADAPASTGSVTPW